MAVGSWDKEGIIDIVDWQLKRPQKEQDIHGRKVTQHHAKTHDAYIEGRGERNAGRKRSRRR